MITNNVYQSVSIVIFTYNGEKYIEETINAAIEQDYKNKKVLIIDDCSVDSTREKINKYRGLPDVNIIHNAKNKGITKNINDTISSIDSDFFILLGHDDLIAPDHLSLMISEFNDAIVSIHCNSHIIDSNGNKRGLAKDDTIQKRKSNILSIRQELAIDNFISSCGMVHRTCIFKLINGWDDKYRNYGEWLYYVKLLDYGLIEYTTKTKAFYRKHDTNITNTFKDKNIKKGLYLYKKTCMQQSFRTSNKSIYFLMRYLYTNLKSYLYVFKK